MKPQRYAKLALVPSVLIAAASACHAASFGLWPAGGGADRTCPASAGIGATPPGAADPEAVLHVMERALHVMEAALHAPLAWQSDCGAGGIVGFGAALDSAVHGADAVDPFDDRALRGEGLDLASAYSLSDGQPLRANGPPSLALDAAHQLGLSLSYGQTPYGSGASVPTVWLLYSAGF